MRIGLAFIFLLSTILHYSQNFGGAKVSIKKLEMNTSLSEISSDYYQGNLLFFQNKRVLQRYSKYYDLFKLDSSSLNNNEGSKKKESLTKQLTIVTNYHEGPCFIDPVNSKIYVTINSLDKSKMRAEKRKQTLDNNKLRLLEGNYQDGVITNLKEFGYNNQTYNVGHATFSNQTNRLYFASDMPGSIGKSDIYYCDLDSEGNLTTPVRLEGKINTTEDEFFPYVKDGILFFSSNAHDSAQSEKDLDIYYLNENEILTGTPKPLKQINSEFDDFGICFNKTRNSYNGFFTSNRENTFSENDDIYSFSFSEVKVQTNYDLLVKVLLDDKLVVTNNSYLLIDNISSIDTIKPEKKGEYKFNSLTKGKLYKLYLEQKDSLYNYSLPPNYKNGLITDTIKFYTDSAANKKKKLTSNKYDLLVNLFLNDSRIPSGNASLLDKKNRVITKNIPSTEDGKYELTNLRKRKKYKFVYTNGPISESFDLPINYESGLKEVTFRMESDLPYVDSILAITKKESAKNTDSIVKKNTSLTVQSFGDKKNESIDYSEINSFENVYFAFDSYKLDKISNDKLDRLVGFYNSGNNIKYILLNAYTDSRGNKAYNDRLSVNRALSCRKYLIGKGIPASKIKFVGFGELNLTNDCGDGVDCPGTKHARNRRVEVSVLK